LKKVKHAARELVQRERADGGNGWGL